MKYAWKIALFAGLPERIGMPEITLELPEGSMSAGSLKAAVAAAYPAHASLIGVSFVACNEAYAPDGQMLDCGDRLALLPPVSGGEDSAAGRDDSSSDMRYVITSAPLDAGRVSSLVLHPDHGAALVFIGTTREWTQGKRTVLLEYEAYEPMALRTLRQIGAELAERWPGTISAISHRIGPVAVGEASVVIAVSSPHRDGGYEASRYAIERLKQIVPIWKKEIWEDGSEWKGHQQGPWNPLADIPSPPAEG
ncbi:MULTISPECIES: molybdenum cofactor biosynthesis protein MoaE [unclassified Paenibacillus]|uniref:molybdenum cofactor biosynthesis protein MoaE n=1 Tax=unclassified Paenibacillus TaxID=185978 RepID=UPI0003F9AC79|nr:MULTISPECIES: molybdenum cofactor biosynthesis protein MoaE [unclassified Paenibacillus]KKC47368.1 molybdopterin converting factor [Paenibacillus sp. D9]CDN45788.1 Molybdopterin biosynthesis MoaE protein [Paenibacillus sp. P22]